MARNMYGTAYQNYVALGNFTHTADGNGLITNVPDAHVQDLLAQRCIDEDAWLKLQTAHAVGITQLTGDVTAGPGAGSQASTLSVSGVSAGTYRYSNVTVDAKGRITAVVPIAAIARTLPLTAARDDTGAALTATAAAGAMGIVRTAGSVLGLAGETTSASAVTDKAVWEVTLPDTYIAASDVVVTVNCNYSGSGTVTAVSCTMTVAAYTEVNGTEAALTVSAAHQIPGTAGNLTFTITGATLVAAQRIVIELTMLITSASGANTGHVNSVSYVA